jgi:hypothetical protein
MNCGLGNNGGSQTIVQSANTLVGMGHDVYIIDTGPNKHTWDKLLAEHIKIKNIDNCPKCDAIIGTGIKTFDSTSKCKNAKNKFHWIRGWETWQIPNEKMLDIFKNKKNVNLLTNGIGIYKILKKNGVDSQIQLAGLDIEQNGRLSSCSDRQNNISIGGLVNTRHKTKQTDYIYNVFNMLKRMTDFNVSLYTYGAEGSRPITPFNTHSHFIQPNKELKKQIYNKIDFWISTSINEGFHIPPAEFMLSNSNNGVVVGVNVPLNGTKQYLIDEKTGFTCENNWIKIADKIIEIKKSNIDLHQINDNAYNHIKDRIGSRHYNMKKFVKIMESV